MTQEENKEVKKKVLPKWLRIVYWFLIILALLFILLSFTLTRPTFQNWAVDYMSEKFSEKLDINISVDSVSLSIKRGIKVWDIAGTDMKGDTLFSGSEISSSLSNNLMSVLRSELYLSDIYLKDIYVNVEESEDAIQSNWKTLLDKLNNSNNDGSQTSDSNLTNEKQRSFLLEVKSVEFENLRYRNKSTSQEQLFSLQSGTLALDSINIDSLHFFVDEIEFVNPSFQLYVTGDKMNKEVAAEILNEPVDEKKKFPWLIINNIDIKDGLVETINEVKQTGRNEIDYNNLRLDNLHVEASQINIKDKSDISAVLDNLSAILDGKLELKKTSFSKLKVEEKSIVLSDFELKTDKTTLRTDNKLKFRSLNDFDNFADKVFMDIDFDDSKFSIDEINYLIPGLANSPIVLNNQDESIQLDGQLKGRVNNFSTNDLKLRIGNKVLFDGKVRVRNVTDPNAALINIEVDRMVTSMNNLTKVIPNFRPPENFYKLKDIEFKGRFDGFLYNFVAFGELNTALGRAVSDMQLDLTSGRNNAKYSGTIELTEFNLREWSGNNDLDLVNLKANVKNGSGLVLNNAKADLDATLNSFSYKGHAYEDLVLNGVLEKNQFDGKFELRDEYADLDFDGSFVFEDEVLNGDFVAKVNKLDLKKLNLTQDSIVVSGDIDMGLRGRNIDDFDGEAIVQDLVLELNGRRTELDSVYLVSAPDNAGNRILNLESDLVNLFLNGKINFQTLGKDLQGLIFYAQPEWAEYLGIEHVESTANQNFNFDIQVKESQELFTFLGQPNLSVNGLVAKGLADTKLQKLQIASTIDSIFYNHYALKETQLSFINFKKRSGLQLDFENLFINEKKYSDVDLDATLNEESVLFVSANSGDLLDTIGQFNLTAEAKPKGKDLHVHLKENSWKMLGSDWAFDKNNEIVLGNKSIYVKDLILGDGNRKIEVQSRDNEDLVIHVSEVDLSLINPFVDDPKFLFGGSTFINFQVLSLFDKPSVQGSFVMPELLFNGDSFGELNLLVEDLKRDKLKVDMNIIRDSDDQMIVLDAIINSQTKNIEGILTADNFQLDFFEYIILDGISETAGHFDLECQIKGDLLKPKLNGRAIMSDGAVRVDYLGNKVFFDGQEVRINEKVIDVTGGIVTDRLGNEATLRGGLYHSFLTNMRMDLNISSDNFLLLDTDKQDNPAYYGTGIGEASVNFSGPFEQANIIVNATTRKGSNLSIPVVSTVDGYDESFINFTEKGKLFEIETDTILKESELLAGANIEINLSLTPDAEVNIIIDERVNEIITGRGSGNLKIISERTGTFDIFGQYRVESGKYLFAALGFVAKPFQVQRGGTITWTGDPLNAALNINAEYTSLRTSTDLFLSEYIGSGNIDLENEAKRKTDVLLSLIIGGTLFEPDINFDLNFPELQGELKSYASNKMRILRSNPTELNDQVAALMLFGSFLPTNNPYASLNTDKFAQTGYHTISEFVSNRLSSLLSGLFEEALIDNNVLSGLDFDIGIYKNSSLLSGTGSTGSIAPDEFEVVFKPQFKNDRITADLGTSYVRDGDSGLARANGGYYDIRVEYAITADRRIKARVYTKNDFDIGSQLTEYQYGAGIRYSKEFGTLAELREIFREEIKADFDNQRQGN